MLKLKAKLLVGVLGLAAAALVAGCNEFAATAPEAGSPRLSEVLAVPQTVTVLQRSEALLTGLSASADIGKAGGTIEIPGAGFKLVIPRDAVRPPSGSKSVRITVKAPAGTDVAYTFEPHGLEFHSPVRFEQSTNHTILDGSISEPLVQGAYFTDEVVSGTATVTELLPAEVDMTGGKIKFYLEHFSGYLVAVG